MTAPTAANSRTPTTRPPNWQHRTPEWAPTAANSTPATRPPNWQHSARIPCNTLPIPLVGNQAAELAARNARNGTHRCQFGVGR